MTNQSVIMPSETLDVKKRVILGAARDLLVQRGFQDVVLDDVARKAGVAKGTLFLYFRSKDELFSAAFADLVDHLGEALEVLPSSGKRGRGLLESTIGTILLHFDRNRDFMSQFGAGRFPGCGAKSSGKLLGKFSDNVRRTIAILRLCAKDGLVSPKELEFSAVALFGLCRSSAYHTLMTQNHRSLSLRTSKVADLFLRGVGSVESR